MPPATAKITNKSKKYYVGLGVLMLVVIGLLLYTVAQGAKAKVDTKTNNAVDNIAKKLDTYVYSNNKVPDSLESAGVKDAPSSVSYTQKDNKSYKLCVNYQAAANGYDGGLSFWWWGLFGAQSYGNDDVSSLKADTSTSYLDTYTLRYQHIKGENCQTVTPYINSYSPPPPTSTYNYCDSTNTKSYTTKVIATVDKIDDQNGTGTIYFKKEGQIITDNNGTTPPDATAIISKKYDNISYFCKDGFTDSASSIKAGQVITLYSYGLTSVYVSRADL